MAAKRTRLARARKAAGYSQEQFAEHAGVDRSTVVRWETGETEPQPWLRPKIARLLRVTPEKLEELLVEPLVALATQSSAPMVPALRTLCDSEEGRAWQALACQAGAAIELDACLDFDVTADGWVRLTGRHELLNLSREPISRLTREVWFEHTEGPLRIQPVRNGEHRIAIQRVHDTYNLAKFACLVSPSIQPGESAVVGYICEGGQFVSDHYWQQTIVRYTRNLSLRVLHRGRTLVHCTAIEDHVDGAQRVIGDALRWDERDGDVIVDLTHSYLRHNQIVTLRWEVNRVDS